MKKLLSILLVLTFVFSLCTVTASAEENIKVIIDIKNVKFDVPPTIVSGRTLVPLRAIFEALGATVDWDDATQTVTSEKGETKISLTINSNIMTVNGEEKTLDVPATLIDSRTLVPVRAISESFGLQVGWDGDNNIVSILSDTETFTMLYAKNSRSRVFAKSSVATQAKHGWYEYPVTAVYSADGKETVVAVDEAQSYLDSGYYAYPVKTVYSKDGNSVVIAAGEYDSYLANGYLAERPVVAATGGESADSDAIDYSEYAGKTEEELAILTVASYVKNFKDPETTYIYSVYAGYYEGQFLVVADIENSNKKRPRGTAVLRLEANSKVSNLYGNIGAVPEGRSLNILWAAPLIDQKTTLFKGYNTNAVRDAILKMAYGN